MPSLLNTLNGELSYDVEKEFKPSEEAENSFSFSDKFRRAMVDESAVAMSIASGYNFLTENNPRDEDFISNQSKKNELYKEHEKDIKPYFKDYIFENSKNIYDFKDNIEFYKKQSRIEDSISDMGLIGETLLRIGGATPDIIPLAVGTISAPVTATVLGSSLISRTVLGGTLATLAEGTRIALGDRERTTLESALSIGLGTAVAGAFGRANSETLEAGLNSVKRELNYDDELEEQIKKASSGELKDDSGNLITVDDVISSRAKELDLSEGQIKSFNTVYKELKKQSEKRNFNKGFMSKLRVDLEHFTKTSPSKSMQWFANKVFPDATLQNNQAGVTYVAEEALQIEKRIHHSLSEGFKTIIDDFGKKVYGKNFISTRFSTVTDEMSVIAGDIQMKRNLFGYSKEQALEYARTVFITKGLNSDDALDFAKRVVAANEKVAKDSYDTLKEYGKKGFNEEEIKRNDSYVPIVYSYRTDEILNSKKITHTEFADFIYESLVSGLSKRGSTIDESFTREVSRVLANVMRKNEYSDLNANKSINDMLKDAADNIGENVPKEVRESLSVFSQEKTPFDYTYKKTFNKDGKNIELSFEDLVNKDMFGVYNQYAKKMGGATALEKIRFKKETTTYDFKKASEIKDGITKAIKENRTLQKAIDRFTSGKQITSESIFLQAEKILPLFGKTIKDVVGKDLKHQDLVKMSNQERGDYLNKLIDDIIRTANKGIEENKDLIDELIGDEFANSSDLIKEFVKDAEEKFRGFASDVHSKIKDIKDSGVKFTDEEYDKLFKEEYDKLIEENREFINWINQTQKDLFSKTEVRDIDMGTQEGVDFIRKKISDELKEAGVTGREFERELTRFDETIRELRGLPTAVNPNSAGMQSQRILRNMNIARLLGQTAFTMAAELGSVIAQNGIRNFLNNAPEAFKTINKQFASGKIEKGLAQEIQTFMGLGGDLFKAIGIERFEHDLSPLSRGLSGKAMDNYLNIAENWSEKFAEATLLFGGVKPLTNIFQMTSAMSSVNEVISLASKKSFSKNDVKFLNEMGIDVNMLGRIKKQMNTHGSFKTAKWSNGHKVQELGFEKWDDAEARKMLITGIRRITDTVVQQSHIGNKVGTVAGKNLFRNSLFGKFFLELKDYMITAYVKQFGRAYTRRDAFMFATIMSQAGFLTLSKTTQNYMNYYGNETKLEENMKPEKIAQSVVANLPMSSYIPPIIDNASDILLDERYLSDSRYHSGIQNTAMSLPSLDLLMKVNQLMKAIPQTIRDGEVSNKNINAAFGIMPLGNAPGIKTIHQSLLEE